VNARQSGLRGWRCTRPAKGILVPGGGPGFAAAHSSRCAADLPEHIVKHCISIWQRTSRELSRPSRRKSMMLACWALAAAPPPILGCVNLRPRVCGKAGVGLNGLGALSGGIYVRWRSTKPRRKATATRLVLADLNVAMVAYLLWDLWQQRKSRPRWPRNRAQWAAAALARFAGPNFEADRGFGRQCAWAGDSEPGSRSWVQTRVDAAAQQRPPTGCGPKARSGWLPSDVMVILAPAAGTFMQKA